MGVIFSNLVLSYYEFLAKPMMLAVNDFFPIDMKMLTFLEICCTQ